MQKLKSKMAKANGLPGFYVVIDGIIGCGKTAQRKQLENYLPLDFPNQKIVFTYEPGGNPEADLIRQRLKFEKMDPREEMRLFAASRSITLPQVVTPVLKDGGIVVSDRSVTTSLAYQAFGRELGIDRVWEANEKAVNGILPDAIVYMNVGREVCFKRSGGEDPDKFDLEDIKFWERTIKGYDEMLKFVKTVSPSTTNIEIYDPEGKLSIDETRTRIKERLYPLIRKHYHEGGVVKERQN